jgi:alanyl-tRNA synthetase
MGAAYPELARNEARVSEVLRQEEVRFFETIEHGMSILEGELAAMQGGSGVFNGATAFKLHDTFGFPLDLTADVCRERGVSVDVAAFDAAMAHQKEQARAAGKFRMAAALDYSGPATTFHGYEALEFNGRCWRCTATAARSSSSGKANSASSSSTKRRSTPNRAARSAIAASAGRAGDLRRRGHAENPGRRLRSSGRRQDRAISVGDNASPPGSTSLARARTVRNHSATHLMHKALREVLGSHVQQKGSLVDAEKTRFDFAHNAPMTADEIRRVELIVNHEILANAATEARVMPIEEAQRSGAMMLFGEKYGDKVRVLTIGSSKELLRWRARPAQRATSACSRSSPKPASPPASAVSRRSPVTPRWRWCSSSRRC